MTDDDVNQPEFLTVTQAASAARVHERTIRRHIADDDFPGKSQGENGRWLIPVRDLVAAGFNIYGPNDPPPKVRKGSTAESREVASLRTQLLGAQRRAEAESHRADLAEERLRGAERVLEVKELLIEALTAQISVMVNRSGN